MSIEQELKLQKGIRQAEDDLVIWVQEALDNSKYDRTGKDKLEESQFRNLVRVSDTTESVEVIKNFLRYQVGRGDKWGRGAGSLAEKILQDIDGNICRKAKEIGGDANYKRIWIELTRRYLGYGARYLKYKLEGETQKEAQPTSKASRPLPQKISS